MSSGQTWRTNIIMIKIPLHACKGRIIFFFAVFLSSVRDTLTSTYQHIRNSFARKAIAVGV